MRKHETTFNEAVLARCIENGMDREFHDLARKTGICQRTFKNHMKDGKWTREQVQEMHRYLHFRPEQMLIYFEGR